MRGGGVIAAVCAWKRRRIDSGLLAPKRSRRILAYIRRSARYLAISSKKSDCAVKKKDSLGAKSSTGIPAFTTSSMYAIVLARTKAAS